MNSTDSLSFTEISSHIYTTISYLQGTHRERAKAWKCFPISHSSAGTVTARWEFWLRHVQVAASHQLLLAGAVFLNEGSLVGKEKISICHSTTVKINPSSVALEHPRGSPDRVSQSPCNESPQVQFFLKNREIPSRCKTSC